jgi:hypothetical protein
VSQPSRAIDTRLTVSQLHGVLADAPTAAAFGNISSEPTMFPFRPLRQNRAHCMALTPDLHEQAEKLCRHW